MPPMIEFELKFQIPPEQREAARRFVVGRQRPAARPVHLQALYVDTPQRLLAQAGIALRLRHEGTGWVQTLKGSAADGLGREEYNLPPPEATDARTPPAIDPQRHRGTRLGDRLNELLAAAGADGELTCRYRSDVHRTTRLLKTPHGTVELAFDDGRLIGAGAPWPICELEIELVDGHPLAVTDVARRWALRYGLWLDIRSKAERGDLLARGQTVAPAVSEVDRPAMHGQHAPRAALQATLVTARQPILANASQIASGRFDDEHVHQLRVALRRLRVYLRLFDDDPAASALAQPLAEPAADLFRRLGAARDQTVLAGPIAEGIESALRRAGDDARPLKMPQAPSAAAEDPVQAVRSLPAQRLLLSLIEATLPGVVDGPIADDAGAAIADAVRGGGASAAAPIALKPLLRHRLRRWQRAIARDADRFAELDEVARHRLRKHVKRLRYAIDASEAVLDGRRRRPIVKALKRAQAVLGDLNDLSTAIRAFGDGDPGDRRAWFARGWLVARHDALVADARRPLRRLAKAAGRKKLR